MPIDKLRTLCTQALQDYHHAARTATDERERLEELEAQAQTAGEAQRILQLVAQSVQTLAHEQISKVVTRCLKTVFQENAYEFKINFERKRGRTEARLVFIRNGKELDPTFSTGGGILDISAFALRIACLILQTPKRRRLLILDEPSRNVNGSVYQERAKELIETLARELDFQIILASDNWLRVGKVIDLGE